MLLKSCLVLALTLIFTVGSAQVSSHHSDFLTLIPRNYQVQQAIEVESLVPMFFYGGFHYAVGYRYHKFRLRASVINGGR